MKNRNLTHADHWATPKDFYNKLDAEFHFDFDPCPLHAAFDGLDKDIKWGMVNFINPPYSRKLKEAFITRAWYESCKGNGATSVLLLPVSTSTKIFHEVILFSEAEIRFVKGRIKFEGYNTKGEFVTDKTPMHDSMIVIFRPS